MSNLGKIVNSLFSATNENTIALANLNFDFSILKYEAPKEFQAIGSNLSSRRKDEAEDGKTHKIASRLGALFRSIVPTTPHLINAYGSRASQIVSSPDTNPAKNPKYGPFADFVGIDGTSLWAAATSAQSTSAAHAPLAMYLLACILARRWDPSEAVSIWAEVVHQRQCEIEASLENEPQHISLFMAAKHEISRDDLACWDASARAWLQSADQARVKERSQFDLIAKNISIEIGSGVPTYQNVIQVWRCAMQGMDDLIQGIPQELSDGAILLALSAWHLYPDLIILGKKTQLVSFQDPLIATGGTITVGLQYAEDVREPGMHWSLTLSQLRYYETDVKVKASTDTSRISFQDLLVIAFGSLMSSWGVPHQDEGTAAQILVELYKQSALDYSSLSSQSNSPSYPEVSFAEPTCEHNLHWLRSIAFASTEFLDYQRRDRVLCDQLTAWGRRRAKAFLACTGSLPFFGIANHYIRTALTKTDGYEATLSYLRDVADSISARWRDRTLVVRYRQQRQHVTYFEFATVTPHTRRSNKRDLDGSLRSDKRHFRWLYLTRDEDARNVPCSCGVCGPSCPCTQQGTTLCSDFCHMAGAQKCQGLAADDENRLKELEYIGEDGHWVSHYNIQKSRSNTVMWRSAPPILQGNRLSLNSDSGECPSMMNGFDHCSCAESSLGPASRPLDDLILEVAYGDPDSYCIFAASNPQPVDLQTQSGLPDLTGSLQSRIDSSRASIEDLQHTLSLLERKVINPRVLLSYLQSYDGTIVLRNQTDATSRRTRGNMPLLLKDGQIMTVEQRTALNCLDTGQQVYERLLGASIPLSITAMSLGHIKWLPPSSYAAKSFGDILYAPAEGFDNQDISNDETTALHFACIIYFESGVYNIPASDCKEVVAVAAGNSIFVASYLMSDPLANKADNGYIYRIAGNVGMAGMSMLVTPQQPPRTRLLGNDFRIVPHNQFDGENEDNFLATTLHLRFTKWRRPYNIEARGNIDEGLFFVESVVSLHDSGAWVSDLDVRAIKDGIEVCAKGSDCLCEESRNRTSAVSIDSWEELLDPPERLGIVRSHGNWPARLAALALRCQGGHQTRTAIVPSDDVCCECIALEWTDIFNDESGVVII